MGSDHFTLEAGPGSDVWRKPPNKDIFNVPVTRTVSGSLRRFKSARVTFWADWVERYDQGGLIFVLRRATATSSANVWSTPATDVAAAAEKWIKMGIELYAGKPHLSTVACDRYADWAIAPLSGKAAEKRSVTLEAVRESDENGRSLWVYQVLVDAQGNTVEKIPLREICWIFADDEDDAANGQDAGHREWIVEVSPLVARPATSAKGTLSVTFTEFKVNWLP